MHRIAMLAQNRRRRTATFGVACGGGVKEPQSAREMNLVSFADVNFQAIAGEPLIHWLAGQCKL